MAYANTLASLSSASQKIRTAISLFTPSEGDSSFSSFSNIVKNLGVAKAYRFGVWFDAPKFMMDDKKGHKKIREDITKINLLAESAMFPEFVLNTNQIHDAGQTREFVHDKIYPPVTMTFICDGDMIVKEFFDQWIMGALKTEHGTYRYKSEYTIPEMTIVQYNDKGDPVYSVFLKDVYPKLVNDIVMSSSSRDFSRCQVQFAYRTWESVRFKQAAPSQDEMKALMDKAYSFINAGQLLKTTTKILK